MSDWRIFMLPLIFLPGFFGSGFKLVLFVCYCYFAGLTNLENLNLDFCGIGDEGLANLTGLLLCFTNSFYMTVMMFM